VEVAPRRRAAAGGDERGCGATKLVGGPDLGKRIREPWGFYCLPWFGLGCSGEGSSAVAGVLGRRQWWAAALGLGRRLCSDGGGLWSSAARGKVYLKAWQGGGGLAGCGWRPASGAGWLNGVYRLGAAARAAMRHNGM